MGTMILQGCAAVKKNRYFESMRKIFVNDRLLGVGVKEARMEILGGQVWNREELRRRNLETAFWLGREF